jgi:FkbM family methyltransferase
MKSHPTAAPLPLKQCAQAFLKHMGIYQRLKSSFVYDVYWSLANPRWLIDRAAELEFYQKALAGFEKGNVIFDIGANDGCKTNVFLRLGAKVVAVDPDETNLETLKGKFIRNRLFPKPVSIEGKAVSDHVGLTTMWIDAPGSALNTLNAKWAEVLRRDKSRFGHCFDFALERQIETVTLEELISRHGIPFYIKIDVEGHELNVLRGLRRRVPYLSFEVNLPEFKNEGLKCVQALHGLAADGEFNYVAGYENGLKLEHWVSEKEFVHRFERCEEPAIEIFWRTAKRFQ